MLHIKRIEPPRGKTNNVVSEEVGHKPACTSTEKTKKLDTLNLLTRAMQVSYANVGGFAIIIFS